METDHNLESADSRDEKRWMKSEIDRKMKKMKKDEVARVGLLVERASKFLIYDVCLFVHVMWVCTSCIHIICVYITCP